MSAAQPSAQLRPDALLDLQGRIALVTGGGQGVGREICHYLAAHNAGGVAVLDFYGERARHVVDELVQLGGRGLAVTCDVTDFALVSDAVARAERELGPIEILVNNAGNSGADGGTSEEKAFWESEPDDWRPWLAVNLEGVLNCTSAVARGMVERRYGRVVTIVSDAARVGEPHLVAYSAAKAGAAGFTRAFAKAAGRHGITANCVSLAAMRTPALEAWLEDEEAVKTMLRKLVIRRVGEPTDAAALVLFLVSDAASWITGQTYSVNGGYAMGV
jgi:3-oxoacyl-[acyl-carrier protein] reductase